ncbi:MULTISPECIES: hypothetical protein [Streptomyces]|uniref:hypothetical protein n=1 Tax=Streptomyces TaxID=1883 RepID=UPI001B37ACEB|nr:hypothetical protein [Streptomyces sp. RK75]MBQ0863377.1 hypothetical protein [Streptomyces sp. RK75]
MDDHEVQRKRLQRELEGMGCTLASAVSWFEGAEKKIYSYGVLCQPDPSQVKGLSTLDDVEKWIVNHKR